MKLTQSAITHDHEPGEGDEPPRLEPLLLTVGDQLPERGVGGWMPKPRNESAASTRIAAAMISVMRR